MDEGREDDETCVRQAHVIVVDDEPSIREICADVLSSEGYQVSTAKNGQEAVDIMAQEPIDLVLMDIMMPVMDGLSACKAIKADERTRDVPVVIMSAAHNLRERVSEVHCIAEAVVPKPFDFDQLLETVGRLICGCKHAPGWGAA
jgi:putative two-component system response regulator